jgi:hypothetical protein
VTDTPEVLDGAEPDDVTATQPPAHPADEYERVRVRKRTSSSRSRRRRRTAKRVLIFGSLGVVGLGLFAAGWVLITAMMAKSQLEHVRANLDKFQGQVSSAELKQLRLDAADIRRRSDKAHSLTSGPAWAVMANLPWVGEPLKTVRGIAAQADGLASETVPGILTLSETLDPKNLRQADGSIRLRAVEQARPVLAQTVNRATSAAAAIQALPASTWMSQADQARAKVLSSLASLNHTLKSLDHTAGLLLPMLGSEQPKRYFIGFVNEAELRGSGGLPGSFAIAEVSDGQIKLTHFGADNELDNVVANVDLGPDYNALYASAQPANTYLNSNISPNFPDAAKIWAAMWKAKTGEQVDGAILIDPTALGYLLDVTGPAALPDGEQLTGTNVVAMTQQTLYSRFASDNNARKQYLIDIARTASGHLLSGSGDSSALIKAALKGAAERRVAVWSSDPDIEKQLEATTLSGELPDTKDPFTGAVVINAGGNKLDYYLNRELSWVANGCGSTRSTEATITLSNDAPSSGLPEYVTERNDKPAHWNVGDNVVIVQYYATRGAKLTAASLNGEPLDLYIMSEQGHPVYMALVELPRGKKQTIKFYTDEPNDGAPVKVLSQPGVTAEKITATAESCR